MIVKAAYLGIIIIWTTTPLAIQWSSGESGYLLAVTARMAIGLCVLTLLFTFMRLRVPITKQAVYVYLLSGLSIFLSMLLVYWGAQFIPSGWIAIIFGLSPIITGIFTSVIFKQNIFSLLKLFGLILAITGLIIIFGNNINISDYALCGITAVFISTITHALGAVLIKRVNTTLSGMQATQGGLIIAVPLFGITMIINQGSTGYELSMANWLAIVYLGLIATALGFSLYYFVLKNLDTMKVSMITLITPVTALLLGALLNNETLTLSILLGVSLILAGLAIFEFDKHICRNFTQISNKIFLGK